MFPERKSHALIFALCALLISAGSSAQTRGTLKGGSDYDRNMQQAGMSGMSGMSGDGSLIADKPVKKKKRVKKGGKKTAAPK